MSEPINLQLNFINDEDAHVHSSCQLSDTLWCLVPPDERQICDDIVLARSYDLKIRGQKCMFL